MDGALRRNAGHASPDARASCLMTCSRQAFTDAAKQQARGSFDQSSQQPMRKKQRSRTQKEPEMEMTYQTDQTTWWENAGQSRITQTTIRELLDQTKRQRFQFIRDNRNVETVKQLCQWLQVSRSGFYKWLAHPVPKTVRRHQTIAIEIKRIHQTVSADYGSPRMHHELRRRGFRCSRNTVAKVMRQSGLAARQVSHGSMVRPKSVRFSRCDVEKHRIPDYLERDFKVNYPDVCWSIDITCITTQQGDLYLCAVEDLYSRMIVGFAFGESSDWRLALRAIRLAFMRRKPGLGIVIHSDSASPFGGNDYQSAIAKRGVQPLELLLDSQRCTTFNHGLHRTIL